MFKTNIDVQNSQNSDDERLERRIRYCRMNIRQSKKSIKHILQMFPNMELPDVSYFTRFYYPIAILDVAFEEKSFTDFKPFEIAILRLLKYGISNTTDISNLMGLPEVYIKRLLSHIVGLGYYDGQLTVDGEEAIREGKKTQTHRTRQAVQVDAITGHIISLENLISQKDLVDSKDTTKGFHHLEEIDEMNTYSLANEIVEKYSREVEEEHLHVNVTKINNISFKEMKYAECYAIKFNDDKIILLLNRKNYRGKRSYDNYYVLNSIPEDKLLEYGVYSEKTDSSIQGNDYAEGIENYIFSDAVQSIVSENFSILLSALKPEIIVREDKCRRNKSVFSYYIERDDIVSFDSLFCELINSIANREEYYTIAVGDVCGLMLRLYSYDELLGDIANIVADYYDGVINEKLKQLISNTVSNMTGHELCKSIKSILIDSINKRDNQEDEDDDL